MVSWFDLFGPQCSGGVGLAEGLVVELRLTACVAGMDGKLCMLLLWLARKGKQARARGSGKNQPAYKKVDGMWQMAY